MDHELSSTLLTDLLAGRLSGERATAAWAHVGSCPQCQEAASAIHQVRATFRRDEPDPLAGHPRAEDLVALALGDGDLPLEDLARVRLHVERCAPCREAVALTRGAEAGTGRLPERLAGWLDRAGSPWTAARLAPALAVAAVLLAYPAWIGLVRYPEAARDAERLRRDLAARPVAPPEVPRRPAAEADGGARLLYLRPASRAADAPPRLPSGATAQPVALELDLAAQAAHRPAAAVRIEIRDRSGAFRWRLVEPADRLWDPVNRLAVFLVPAGALAPGEHRLEVRVPGRPEPVFTARFVIDPPAGGASSP